MYIDLFSVYVGYFTRVPLLYGTFTPFQKEILYFPKKQSLQKTPSSNVMLFHFHVMKCKFKCENIQFRCEMAKLTVMYRYF